MAWNKEKIDSHRKTAKILGEIKDAILEFIKNHPKTSELEVQNFILEKFKQNSLKNEIEKPIVAFRENTSFVHYYPSPKTNKKLKKNSLILLDIWARHKNPGSPYADMTWVAWYGERVPPDTQKVFEKIISARDKALDFIRKNAGNLDFLTGRKIDAKSRNFIEKSGFKGKFPHGLGHELGFYSPHGKGRPISSKNLFPIKKELAYTIEPGIYLKGKFGIRSEIDFYLDSKNRLIVTTQIQKSFDIIKSRD